MKHIIEFNLPEENDELKTTLNASNYYCALWDFSQEVLRAYDKYGIPEQCKDMSLEDFISHIRERFNETLSSNDVSL